MMTARAMGALAALALFGLEAGAEEFQRPYSPPCVERENVFEFTEKPKVASLGNDKYEIAFAVKGHCDATVDFIDEKGAVVRHLASGVLGPNAPAPFQKSALKQTLQWNGKDDLGAYVKEPERLRLRVRLGLKPEFDKRLGGTSPHNIPGRIKGLATAPDGLYVFSMGRRSKFFIRKFDLAGNYLQALVPPPANLPVEKLQGMGFIEYEKDRRALHGTDVYQTTGDHLRYPVRTLGGFQELQPAVVGNRIYFSNTGQFGVPSAIYRLYSDGSTDTAGLSDRLLIPVKRAWQHLSPRFCASPDGRFLYLTGISNPEVCPSVFRLSADGSDQAEAWVGDPHVPGGDEAHLNKPCGLACDAQGRVYVADLFNGRVQVFSPEAKLLKSIPIPKPMYVSVHQKTGTIYIQHDMRVDGKTVRRTTKLRSWNDPVEEGHVDGPYGAMALDSWSAKPRLWYSNTTPLDLGLLGDTDEIGNNLTAWEDEGGAFKKVCDFDEAANREDGRFFSGRWGGTGLGERAAGDPLHERVMISNRRLFDLKTGLFLTGVKIPAYSYDDVAFDKKGYLHVHLNPGFDGNPGVLRVDPLKAKKGQKEGEPEYWPECPYDYGIELPGAYSEPRKGVLPCKDQPGAKYFQDGLGVAMGGNVATETNIYHVPKFDDMARDFIKDLRGELPPGAGGRFPSYEAYARKVKEAEMRGETVYSIHKEPGVALAGGTVWTWEASGELKKECAVTAGGLINGVMLDEDGEIYFVAGVGGRTRMIEGRPFLSNRGGRYGVEKSTLTPFTGTAIKTRNGTSRLLWQEAPVKLDPLPARPPELSGPGWVEGAEWLYAGASPIVSHSCSCPAQRLHLDWYKRVYVPEQYRHSIGVLDTGGNLILHIGSYGNFDSGDGPKSRIRIGGDEIAMSAVRYLSGTDNYLVFEDGGERLVVLKLNYHAEEIHPLRMK